VFEKKKGSGGTAGGGGASSSGQKTPSVRYEGLPVPLIMDGKVQEDNLRKIGKNLFWLRQELKERGIANTRDVFLCTIDHKGRLYVDRKEE